MNNSAVTCTLLAGSRPADSTKVASAFADLTAKGLRVIYVYSVSPDEESAMAEEGKTYISKQTTYVQPNTLCLQGTPVTVVMTQKQNQDGSYSMEVDIYNAVTEDLVSSNDNGDLPPIVKTKESTIKRLNDWAGREIAASVSPALAERAELVQSAKFKESKARAEAEVKSRIHPRPVNIEHDLAIATMLINKEQAYQLTQRKFNHIGKNSRRYGGEWSRGENMTQSDKTTLDSKRKKRYAVASH